MPDPTGIFISYRRSDTKWAAILLHSALQRTFPSAQIFYDGDTLKMGVKWPDRLSKGLDDCCVLLALIGEKWAAERHPDNDRIRLDIEEDWVRTEIDHALRGAKHVIPVLIDEAELPADPLSLPSCLRKLLDHQPTRLRGPGDSESDIQRILDRLKDLLPKSASATPPPPPNPQSRPAPAPSGMIAIEDAADLIAEAAGSEETLMAVAKYRHDAGQYFLTEAIYCRAAAALSESRGPEDDLTLIARHNQAGAILLQDRAAGAETLWRDLLPLQEKVKGPEHPHTLSNRRLIALAALEQGAADRARVLLDASPDDADPKPTAKARAAMLRGWLADLDGDPGAAAARLDQADTLLSDLPPEHYMRRDLAKYRETRVPGGTGGTMLWALDNG